MQQSLVRATGYSSAIALFLALSGCINVEVPRQEGAPDAAVGGGSPDAGAQLDGGNDDPGIPAVDLSDSIHRLADASGFVTFATDGMAVFWVHSGSTDILGNQNADGAIWRWLPGSDSASTVVTGQYRARGIAVDADSIYWSAADTTTAGVARILRASKEGSNLVTLATIQYGSEHLEVDDLYVYWSESGPVYRTRKDGTGTPQLLVNSQNGFTLGPDALYYNDNQHGVMRVGKDGSGPPVEFFATIDFLGYSGLVNAFLYVASEPPPTYLVHAVPLAGGLTKTVINQELSRRDAEGHNVYSTVYPPPAVDSDGLYWFRFWDSTTPAELYVAPTSIGLPRLVGTLPRDVAPGGDGALMAIGARLMVAYSGTTGSVFWMPKPVY